MEKQDGIRSFLSALGMTALFLTLTVMVAVASIRSPESPEVTSSDDVYTYHPLAEDSLTVVVIGLIGETPSDLLLVRYHPQYKQIPLMLLPPQASIEETTFSKIYTEKGPEALKRAISQNFHIKIDRYAVVSQESFLQVFSKIGTIHYNLPYPVEYTTQNGPVRFSAGLQRLDAQALLELFSTPQLRTDPVERSALLGEIIATGVNQHTNLGSEKRALDLFSFAINLIKTDINSVDFELRRQSLDYLSSQPGEYATNLPINGHWDSNQFILADSTKKDLQEHFEPLL